MLCMIHKKNGIRLADAFDDFWNSITISHDTVFHYELVLLGKIVPTNPYERAMSYIGFATD